MDAEGPLGPEGRFRRSVAAAVSRDGRMVKIHPWGVPDIRSVREGTFSSEGPSPFHAAAGGGASAAGLLLARLPDTPLVQMVLTWTALGRCG